MVSNTSESGIVVRPSVFDESYLPDNIECHIQQLEQIKACLEPVKRRMKPMNCWVYGTSGCGKSLLVRSVLASAEKSLILGWAYINCWETPTLYLVLDELVHQLRILGADIQMTMVKLHAIEKHLANTPFVIVIDELDMVSPKERSTILYNLSSLEKVGLFCIATGSRAFNELDPRVKSRLNPVSVPIQSYTEKEVVHILQQRADAGLSPGSYSDESLRTIARMANGNVRIAIQTLRNAVLLAEKRRAKRLLPGDIDQGYAGASNQSKQSILNELTTHHRLLCEIVTSRGVIASGDLWREYLQKCKARKIPSMAPRTYALYVRRLVEMRVFQEEIVIQQGRKRLFKMTGTVDLG
jgi:cell division control protein 6